MPKILTVQYRSGFAPLNLPRPRAVDLGGGAFRAVEGFGDSLGRIADRLQENVDELELSTLEGEYTA